jgi:Uma2 family endonuclease
MASDSRRRKAMAITASEHRVWTFTEFCNQIPEGLKADLIEGVIHVASPDNIEHFDINAWCHAILRNYLHVRKLKGRLFGYRIAFRLDDENAPEPDLAYVRPEHAHLIEKNCIKGPPDWAVEIVSPSSVERDYHKKRAQYERFGVTEYWIIDPLEESMTCFRLGKTGKYKEVRPRDGKIASQVIPGFWIKPEWCWKSPLPDEDELLQEILATVNGKA